MSRLNQEMTMDSTAPTPGSGGRPYWTELSPVSFLRRSAYVFPDKVAVVHGELRTTYVSSTNG